MKSERPKGQPEINTPNEIVNISGVNLAVASWLLENYGSPRSDNESCTFILHESNEDRIGIESITCSMGKVHFNVSYPIGRFIENEIDTAIDTLVLARFSRSFIEESGDGEFSKTFKPHEYGFIDCWSKTCDNVADFQAAFSKVETSVSQASERVAAIREQILKVMEQ